LRSAVTALVEASGGRPVRSVVLAAGPGVDVESAAAAWRVAAGGTCLDGASVRWQRTVDVLRCFDCGREYDGQAVDPCPMCGGNGIVVAPADELAVVAWTT
jgi:hydrogenase nickel incorporation protein HypA/HybF